MTWLKGTLTPDGAKRLGFPHLAGVQVDYELRCDKQLGRDYAGEIYYEGVRLGSLLVLGESGIIPLVN
jgi:hypothetical protein